MAFAGYNNSGSVNGTRSNQIHYTINGTDNNDLYLNVDAVNQGGISGIPGVVFPIDALDEYTLQTTGNSESGRSPGGNLNVTTKSGSNQIHGDAYYYNRNEALAVLSPFVNNPGSPFTNARHSEHLDSRTRVTTKMTGKVLLIPLGLHARHQEQLTRVRPPQTGLRLRSGVRGW